MTLQDFYNCDNIFIIYQNISYFFIEFIFHQFSIDTTSIFFLRETIQSTMKTTYHVKKLNYISWKIGSPFTFWHKCYHLKVKIEQNDIKWLYWWAWYMVNVTCLVQNDIKIYVLKRHVYTLTAIHRALWIRIDIFHRHKID